jgi:hypothetical protein
MKTKSSGHSNRLTRTLDGPCLLGLGNAFHGIGGFIMKVSQCLLIAVIGMLAGGGIAFAQDPVFSDYTAGNGYSSGFVKIIWSPGFGSNSFYAVAFTVPAIPPITYKLDRIELSLKLLQGSPTNSKLTIQLLDGPPGSGVPLEAIIKNGQFGDPLVANSLVHPLLVPGQTYWLYPDVSQNGSTDNIEVRWPVNAAGVNDYSSYFPDLSTLNWSVPSISSSTVFRIVGTPVTAQAVKPSYSSYTAPSGGGPATVYLEVVCPTSPLSNPFTMPVSASIPPNQTPAQVCQVLANAINACGCPCWGGPGCPQSPAPYGFHAVCSGSVLRVTNSTAGLCPGAFVCADHADGLTKYSARKQLEGIGGAIAMEIKGVATGVARDPTASNDVNVIRTLPSGSDSPPQVFQGQVKLARGMEAGQIRQSLAAALSSQGDTGVVVEGNRLIFSPPGREGNYDIAFQVNDTGLDYAFSPPFSYTFFDYVARFAPAPVPTVSNWRWIILILFLLVVGAIFALRSKKKARV